WRAAAVSGDRCGRLGRPDSRRQCGSPGQQCVRLRPRRANHPSGRALGQLTLAPPWPYRAATALAVPLARALALVSSTVAAAVRGREESQTEFADFARTRRTDAPLLLFHAPSAGEWRQAESVVRSLRAFRPGLQFAFTYTSPSARAVAAELHPEVHGFLPW